MAANVMLCSICNCMRMQMRATSRMSHVGVCICMCVCVREQINIYTLLLQQEKAHEHILRVKRVWSQQMGKLYEIHSILNSLHSFVHLYACILIWMEYIFCVFMVLVLFLPLQTFSIKCSLPILCLLLVLFYLLLLPLSYANQLSCQSSPNCRLMFHISSSAALTLQLQDNKKNEILGAISSCDIHTFPP